MSELTFSVNAHSENPTKTVVKTRTFQMIIDEPADLGGTNEGANPVEYVLAALSGCLNVMCHVVAQEMDIKLRGVEIQLAGKLNPDKLFGKETSDRAGYKEITVEINPDTDADRPTLEKWLEAVESRCPVSDNLNNPTPVHIKLK
ncbi:MAG: OsmC family protein [Proteiniphilum sp.]|nr:OsmC family protein [Proteiniphilum sp.]MDD4486576.1 OsmC family protein [Proteiniphilum sp.]MDD5620936.1 OsmC family protein [Proteiniphilum sp.]MDY0183990.1 OsmC family protein [Proteiniphilum sp.]